MRNELVPKLLRWTMYPAFFLFCLGLFSYFTFPYERLKDRIVDEAAKQGYEVEIIDLSPSWVTGATLEGVRVGFPRGRDEEKAAELTFDQITVRAAILPLIFGTKSFSFDADLAGGEIDGDFAIGDESLDLDVELDEVELNQIPMLREYTKVPVRGMASGEIVLEMPADVRESTGQVQLTIADLKVGDGKSKVEVPDWGGLTIDETDLGTLELQALIKDGVANIEEAKAHGADAKLDATGSVRLARPLGRSQLDLLVRMRIEEAYKKKSSRIASVLELASARPEFQSAQTKDGSLQYKLTGSLAGRLQPRAAGSVTFDKGN